MESIGYVILYSLYKHAVEDSQVSDDLRGKLSKEITDFFSAGSIAGLLSKRALRFSRKAPKSMPNLLVYLRNDAALSICAIATFTLLSHLNQMEEPQENDVDPFEAMMAKGFAMPRGMPFDEAYSLWIELLREAALELPGAQGSAWQ